MNLTKKIIDIDDRYCMYFDMESVLIYKEAKKNFYEVYQEVMHIDMEATLDFIACTLRDKENNNKPVGFEFVRTNPLWFFFTYQQKAIEVLLSGFEDDSAEVKKK